VLLRHSGPPRAHRYAVGGGHRADSRATQPPRPVDQRRDGDVDSAQVFRPTLAAVFAINRRVVRTVIGRGVRQALAEQSFPALRVGV